jgi:hypothetical protein
MSRTRELRHYMDRMAFDSFEPSRSLDELAGAGFTGVQFAGPANPHERKACLDRNLGITGSGRVNTPEEAAALAEQSSGEGYECVTVHAGWGMEDDREAHRLIEAILTASSRFRIPLYVETHRATIFQDIWRTVQFVHRFPELRFNGDFSHWYAGQEMVYGGFENKLLFIAPVLDRVRFVHGRIASPGCIQVAIDPAAAPEPSYVTHFRQLWTASFQGHQNSGEDCPMYFVPELLAPAIYYARTFHGVEESDRWQQSLFLKDIAAECFHRLQAPA